MLAILQYSRNCAHPECTNGCKEDDAPKRGPTPPHELPRVNAILDPRPFPSFVVADVQVVHNETPGTTANMETEGVKPNEKTTPHEEKTLPDKKGEGPKTYTAQPLPVDIQAWRGRGPGWGSKKTQKCFTKIRHVRRAAKAPRGGPLRARPNHAGLPYLGE